MTVTKALVDRNKTSVRVIKNSYAKAPVRLLYVAPFDTPSGYYRMRVPFEELGKRSGFDTRITDIAHWNFDRIKKKEDIPISYEQILWADYIIFPQISEDGYDCFGLLKKLNTHVKLVMDITSPLKAGSRKYRQLCANMKLMNVVTYAMKSIKKFCKDQAHFSSKRVYHVPSYLSKLPYKKYHEYYPKKTHCMRIGLIGTNRDLQHWRKVLPALQQLQNTYPEYYEVVVFGWDGIWLHSAQENPFKAIKAEYHAKVPFSRYLDTLRDLRLDMVLHPRLDSYRNTYLSDIIMPELASMGIYSIVDQESSLSSDDMILHCSTVIKNDWRLAIKFVTHSIERKSRMISSTVWRDFSFDKKAYKEYKKLYTIKQ